ncbi:MAG: nuclear transport factor 2 family protein [bacterium]|nr:nuclear transport factor 2 family protein [bacterium]
MADSETELIKDLYRRYWQYMIAKDAGALRQLLDDEYYLTHMTGIRQSKEEFLSQLLDGTFNYYAAEHDSIEVSVSGDTASMTGKSRVVAAVYGGSRHSWRLRGDFTLQKYNGIWNFTSSKASTY